VKRRIPILAGPLPALTGYTLLQPRLLIDPLVYPHWATVAITVLALFVTFVGLLVLNGVLLQVCLEALGGTASGAYVVVLFGLGPLGALDWASTVVGPGAVRPRWFPGDRTTDGVLQ
jgi:hypothetical protein